MEALPILSAAEAEEEGSEEREQAEEMAMERVGCYIRNVGCCCCCLATPNINM